MLPQEEALLPKDAALQSQDDDVKPREVLLLPRHARLPPGEALSELHADLPFEREGSLRSYMCSMMLSPNAEHLTSVAPSIRRAKS